MMNRTTTYLLAGGIIIGGGAFAMFSSAPTPSGPSRTTDHTSAPEPEPQAMPIDPNAQLPPGHPPIGGDMNGSQNAMPQDQMPQMPSAPTGEQAIRWTVPPSWQVAPNPNTMRLATYKIPRVPGDTSDGDVSVTRVGGSKEANIERWRGQFENPEGESREEKVIHGLHVTIISLSGKFSGGMMPGAMPSSPLQTSSAPSKKSALLAAIIETEDMPYFFKITGPLATIKSARPAFDAMVASLAPTTEAAPTPSPKSPTPKTTAF
jgi:hypothetical protein